MRRRTLRGQFTEGEVKRLVVDDGTLYRGFKVIEFYVSGDPGSSANDVFGTLGLQYDTPVTWDWGDNRQIGWASTNVVSTSGINTPFSILDPDHVVLRDLYIQGQVAASGGSSIINYLVVLEPVFLSDDEAIITLIKERSQDDLR